MPQLDQMPFALSAQQLFKRLQKKSFKLMNDFHQWQAWSPWENIDPTMQRTYSGTSQGVGTIYDWEGKGKVGA